MNFNNKLISFLFLISPIIGGVGGESKGFISRFEMCPITTSINNITNISNSQFACYPNPAGNQLNLSFTISVESIIKIEIVDLLGQSVVKENYGKVNGELKKQIDISNFSNGIYFIKAIINDKVISTKFIKQ